LTFKIWHSNCRIEKFEL